MKEVTLNDKAISQLKNCDEYLTLREENGRVIGYFVPIDPRVREGKEGMKSPITDEELERRSQ